MNDESLFHLALEKPAAERLVFLEQASGGDAALRQRVEALLRSHETPDSFLIRSAENPEATTDSNCGQVADAGGPGGTEEESTGRSSGVEGPGSRIGPYKLLQPIGEGGMGTVYMAEQRAPVHRMVALKLIKAGMNNRQVLARFGAERQALALMDHSNIARVFDAGSTEQGVPYFVMELVKGIPITRFCDERRLTTRERLELAIPVCQAVQHAHQKGIIHRDLKPSNVLIALYDGKPIPKIIDFGVAKATGPKLTDQTLYTEFGAVVGTLEYMSPEQAQLNQLDIDTRSDIYSLGVLLYELLTGSTPLDRKRLKQGAILEMLRLIREEESPRPSMRLSTTEELPSIAACRNIEPRKLSGLVRGELDWIVMKTLEKNRTRRYETATGLAADLRRYLDDEPVQACPPSARYRFGKFARRNRAVLTTGGLVSLALIAGVAASTWQTIRATRAERAARLAQAAILKERNGAVLLQHRAEERARWMLLEVARMDDVFAAAEMSGELDLEPWQRDFIQRTLMILENYVQEFGDDVDSRYETAVVCLRLGRIESCLGRFQAAEAYFRRALPLWEALANEFPANLECRSYLAACLVHVGQIGYRRNPADADPFYLRALRLVELLAVQFPESARVQLDLAAILITSGRVFARSGSPDKAEPYYQRALSILIRLSAEPLERVQPMVLKTLLSNACQNLESVLTATGHADEVDRVYGDTLLHLESVRPASSEYGAVVQNRWAWSLVTRPDVQSRKPRRAVELAKKAVERAPKAGNFRKTLGVAHYRAGDWRAAIEALTKSMELREGGDSNDWFFLAMAHWQLGDKPQARSLYNKAVQWMEKKKPKDEELIRFHADATALLGVNEK